MQVAASEFVALICTLLVIIAGLCGYAFKLHRELILCNASLQRIEKEASILRGEVAALNHFVEKHKEESTDAIAPPLDYKKKFLA